MPPKQQPFQPESPSENEPNEPNDAFDLRGMERSLPYLRHEPCRRQTDPSHLNEPPDA